MPTPGCGTSFLIRKQRSGGQFGSHRISSQGLDQMGFSAEEAANQLAGGKQANSGRRRPKTWWLCRWIWQPVGGANAVATLQPRLKFLLQFQQVLRNTFPPELTSSCPAIRSNVKSTSASQPQSHSHDTTRIRCRHKKHSRHPICSTRGSITHLSRSIPLPTVRSRPDYFNRTTLYEPSPSDNPGVNQLSWRQ